VIEVRIPKPGDAIVEGTLAKWLCADGARVAVGQRIYLLETEKAEMEIEAPEPGILRRVGVEGETYPVGTVIARIE
jgi:pyruvate/2-oxoglutarate dehydrogenase complex dihydrolipoamide acyltransferase (E2) component